MSDSENLGLPDSLFRHSDELNYDLTHNKSQILTNRTNSILKIIILSLAIITSTVGLTVFLGWMFGIELLKSLSSSNVSMKANTSVLFILSGISLILRMFRDRKIPDLISKIVVLFVISVCLLIMSEYIFKWNAGIDELIFSDGPVSVKTLFPGRIAFNTCLCFLLIGIALFLHGSKTKNLQYLSQIILLITVLLAILPILGYMYDERQLLTLAFYNNMALHTAITLLILSTGTLCLPQTSGLLTILTSKGSGGYMARRLLPLTILIPIVFIWVRLITKSLGPSGDSTDVLVLSLFYIGTFAIYIWKIGKSVNAIENDRIKAENELKHLNIELEKRVKERTEQLLESNRELEAFAYSVSHDLRTPLRHLIGFSEILESEVSGKSDPQIIRLSETIKSSAQRMSRLIDELLSYSRLGRTNLKTSLLSLNTLIEEVIHEAHDITKNRDIKWKLSKLPEIKADPILIKLVLQNLINNSIKFTSKKREAVIEVNYSEENENKFTFYIRDNGAGFNMEYASKLFGVFQRLHNTEEFEGTGIGLATVNRIIKRHNGMVWAKGEVDEGATFYFTIPK